MLKLGCRTISIGPGSTRECLRTSSDYTMLVTVLFTIKNVVHSFGVIKPTSYRSVCGNGGVVKGSLEFGSKTSSKTIL